LGRYLASFKVGMMTEKNGLVMGILYNGFMITREQVYERLKTVIDPELHIDIVGLGLIYDVIVSDETIKIIMTLTTPGCPLAPEIDRLVRDAMSPLGEFRIVVDLVWEPAWTKDRMSDEAKLQLGVI
jgi:metal-sulfur cluster biosynthetic enzyme